jgi:hypothetical protein
MSITIRIFIALILIALLAGLAMAKPPAPGSKDDPLVTKSYVDSQAGWRAQHVTIGTALVLPTGSEVVVVSAEKADSLSLKEANFDECALLDLTKGARIQEMALPVAHHFLAGPGKGVKLTFASAGDLMVRGLPPVQEKAAQ